MKYIQYKGITNAAAITYEDLQAYHDGLSHLKRVSRVVEESTLHQFLQYLAESGHISPGLYLFMYALETGTLVTMDCLSAEERARIEASREKDLPLSADGFLTAGSELISLLRGSGYVQPYIRGFSRTIRQLYLFLDLHGLSIQMILHLSGYTLMQCGPSSRAVPGSPHGGFFSCSPFLYHPDRPAFSGQCPGASAASKNFLNGA